MAKTKKGLSLVLAVVMLFSMLAVGAFAADAENAAFTVSTDAAGALKAGDTVTVTVSLTTDYFVGPLAVPVTYDATAFDLVAGSLTVSKIFGDATTDAVTSTQDGSVYVVISPKTSGTPTTAVANNLTLFTFRLTAADVNGAFPIAITDNQKTAANPGGKWYCGSFDSADPKTANIKAIGQTFTKTDASVTIGTSAPNTLVVKDSFANASSVIVDKYAPGFFALNEDITGVIYGIETLGYSNGFETFYALADALTTSLGDANLRITPSSGEGYESTGTLIEVLDADGSTVLETYYFIYFGDVNGDGYVDNVDTTAIKTYALDETSLANIYEVLAGDANGDTYTDNADATSLATAVLNDAGYPVQEELSTMFWETLSPEYGI